ncbi:ATP-binding protein [Gemmata sp. JC717]|uniref:AAA family ATPase n=1 Tax=Gemmata algarum TaxID=2975278 RepID=UPI0021BAFDA2|nr:ATP-binding protein [Gemmata algarum]MDY3553935.1 ATP-binding protein [Gemmata algarum]
MSAALTASMTFSFCPSVTRCYTFRYDGFAARLREPRALPMPTASPPIGLKSIEITDFRRIDRLRLEFIGADGEPSDIAVIGGPNGCGKTTALEACLIAIGFQGQLQGAYGRDAIRAGQREWRIKAEVCTPQGQYHVLARHYEADLWVNVTNGRPAEEVPIPCLYFSSWRSPKLVGALPITAGKPGKRPKDTEHNRIWRAKQHLIDSRAHRLMSEGTSFADSATYEEDLKRLNEVWATFHPKAEERFEVGPVSSDPHAGFDVFLVCKDGRKVPVDALSSGQLELFALFGALMLVKFRDGILVIDEPELHLDPQWHALMIRAIRRFLPSAQLLIATHSPKVFDSVMSFQRHFLVPENDPRAQAWKPQHAGAIGT